MDKAERAKRNQAAVGILTALTAIAFSYIEVLRPYLGYFMLLCLLVIVGVFAFSPRTPTNKAQPSVPPESAAGQARAPSRHRP